MNKRSDAAVQHVFLHSVTHILGIPRRTWRTKEVRDSVSLKFTEKQQQLDTTINEINMLSNMLIYHTTKLSISTTHADGKNKNGKSCNSLIKWLMLRLLVAMGGVRFLSTHPQKRCMWQAVKQAFICTFVTCCKLLCQRAN